MTDKKFAIFSLPVIVAALGYFVDIYDLLLFTIVREPSLQGIGVVLTDKIAVLAASTKIINWQMVGLLIGGILWGTIGDKKGRLSVLFGSIALYSIANFITAYVHTVDQYAWMRFVAGVGLAGELGAGITLVSELLPKEKRGVGTSLVAGIGLSGAVFAYFIYQVTLDWRLCYKIGGGLGIFLLLLRISVAESGMFKEVKDKNVSRGNFLMFFNNGKRFKKYILAILIGLPTWYVIGVLVNLSNRFAKEMYSDSHIGTNLRATAATTIPNMVRGALPLINLMFLNLFQKTWGWPLIQSGIVTGIIIMAITLVAFYFTEETFHKDLNYIEE